MNGNGDSMTIIALMNCVEWRGLIYRQVSDAFVEFKSICLSRLSSSECHVDTDTLISIRSFVCRKYIVQTTILSFLFFSKQIS